ncbi:hypothetical protein [Qipengyuania sp.]|uniref:hypothetical protein n=1 Tax=Qipengyuania sp. TaxID=2004515 RepID=UPI003AF71E49
MKRAQPTPESKTEKRRAERTLHEMVLSEYPIPPWLISGSLLENRWVIRLEDAAEFRAASVPISFDVPIASNQLLSDFQFDKDLLTAKLLLLCSIRVGSITGGKVAAIFVRNYLQFVRWRIGIGIYRNSDLTPDVLENLRGSVRTRGIAGLPPVAEAFQAIKLETQSGRRELPTYLKGTKVKFASNALLRELGVPNMTSVPPSLRREIWELVAEQGLPVPRKNSVSKDDIVPTENRVANFFSPLFALHTFSSKLSHDPLGFIPFPGETRQSIARSITDREAERTFTVPAQQACYLIDKALVWVHDYAPDIQRLIEDIERRTNELTGPDGHWRPHERAIQDALAVFEPTCGLNEPGSPWPVHGAYFEAAREGRTRPSLRTILFEYLLIACVIVIAAFSARRHNEINSLRHDCIIETDIGLSLRCYIAKTLRGVDEIPIPATVKAAVDVLRWLSEKRRVRTGEPWIVAFDELLAVRSGKSEAPPEEVKRSGKVQIYRALTRFSEFVETPLLADGSRWSPRPHQFRRWFGVTYYNRYRFPQLIALAHFYRHSDPNQTRRYITESKYTEFIAQKDENRARQRLEDFEKAGQEFRQERFLAVLDGRETMTGFGGEFLKRELYKQIAAYADCLETADDKVKKATYIEAIAPIVKATQLEPNELGHSYCKCTGSAIDLAQAECLKLAAQFGEQVKSGPDQSYASDEICGRCANGVKFPENESVCDKTIAALERAEFSQRSPAVRKLERSRLALLKEQRELRLRD